MPPSAGACQTIDAALNPDCGRAGERSSTITAIGWRAATAGVTRRPVSGSATRTGPVLGVGVGAVEGGAEATIDELDSVDGAGVTSGAADGGVLPSAATRPEPAGVPWGPATSAANIPRPIPPTMARIPRTNTAPRVIGLPSN